MLVQAEHEFQAPLSCVLESLVRDDYGPYLAAHHPFFREVQMLSLSGDESSIVRRVHYRARPPFSHLGPISIPDGWFVWTERSQLDLRKHVLSFENVPEHDSIRTKVVNRGTMSFRSRGPDKCVRCSAFEIDLRVGKGVRQLVELGVDLVAKQVKKSLDAEAYVLASWLANRPAQPPRYVEASPACAPL
jgi:hypothetical protein